MFPKMYEQQSQNSSYNNHWWCDKLSFNPYGMCPSLWNETKMKIVGKHTHDTIESSCKYSIQSTSPFIFSCWKRVSILSESNYLNNVLLCSFYCPLFILTWVQETWNFHSFKLLKGFFIFIISHANSLIWNKS